MLTLGFVVGDEPGPRRLRGGQLDLDAQGGMEEDGLETVTRRSRQEARRDHRVQSGLDVDRTDRDGSRGDGCGSPSVSS